MVGIGVGPGGGGGPGGDGLQTGGRSNTFVFLLNLLLIRRSHNEHGDGSVRSIAFFIGDFPLKENGRGRAAAVHGDGNAGNCRPLCRWMVS